MYGHIETWIELLSCEKSPDNQMNHTPLTVLNTCECGEQVNGPTSKLCPSRKDFTLSWKHSLMTSCFSVLPIVFVWLLNTRCLLIN